MQAAYDTIYFELKDEICQGVYHYKDLLPSEGNLTARFGCAHNTVRKAIAMLASEGYVQSIHGKGVRVIYDATPALNRRIQEVHSPAFESFRKEETDTFATRVLIMENLVSSEEFSAQTGFAHKARLVHLERVRMNNGKAVTRESSYFRADIVADMTKADAEDSVYRYIEQVRGDRIVTSKQVFTIERASELDQRLLGLSPTDHVAVILVAAFDRNGLVCEFTEVRHEPDTFLFVNTHVRSKLDRT